MCVIADHEDVARAVFSPKMVFRGMILPAAFELRPQMAEEYLSVMRMSFNSWKEDIMNIPQRKKETGWRSSVVVHSRQNSPRLHAPVHSPRIGADSPKEVEGGEIETVKTKIVAPQKEPRHIKKAFTLTCQENGREKISNN